MEEAMGNRFWRCLVLLALVFGLASCTMQGFESAISSKSQKYDQLNKRVADLHHDMHWGGTQKSAAFIAPEFQAEFTAKREAVANTEKLVDVRVMSIHFDDTNDTADVTVRTQYYAVPQYVVQIREEKEKWAFERFGGGWLLQGIESVKKRDV